MSGGAPPKTPHEAAILEAFKAGEKIVKIGERFGVSRRTVHAVIDRNEVTRKRQEGVIQLNRLTRRCEVFARDVLRYANTQPRSPQKETLIKQLSLFEAQLKEKK